MAVYGPGTPIGFVPFTGWSPTLGVGDAATPATSGVVQFNGMTQNDDQISNWLRKPQALPMKRLMLALLGAATGGTAGPTTRSRVQATADAGVFPSNYGGLVTIESVSVINRATTATDLSNLQALVNRTHFPASYVAELSGNSGGGKLGY